MKRRRQTQAGKVSIVVERLDDGRYRATSTFFADCQTVAATEEQAREAIAAAVDRLLRDRDRRESCGPASPQGEGLALGKPGLDS